MSMKTKNLVIAGKKKMLEVPDSWEDISVDTYEKLLSVPTDNLTPLEQRMHSVAILLNLPLDIVYDIDTQDFYDIEADMATWLKSEMPAVKCECIEVDGKNFYLYTDFSKLTMGEQISIDLLQRKSGGNLLTVYKELLCLFLRLKNPDGTYEKFSTEHMHRATAFGAVPICKVNQLFLFFSNGRKD